MMDKEIWKWIFDHMFDEELIRLTRMAKIKLDGFRDINAKTVKMIRPKLIQSFLQKKNLNKLRKSICANLSHEKNTPLTSKEECMNEIFRDYRSIVHLLLVSLASDQPEEYKQGVDLYYECKEKGYLQACEQIFSLLKLHNDTRKKFEELHNDYAELEKNYQSLNKTTDALYEENKRLKSANQQLLDQNDDLKNKILESQDKVKRLIEQTTPKIGIIGRITDDQWASFKIDKRVEIIKNIEQVPIESLNHYHEIWMLSYDIPFATRRKILQVLPKTKVKQFDTYIEIQEYIKTN